MKADPGLVLVSTCAFGLSGLRISDLCRKKTTAAGCMGEENIAKSDSPGKLKDSSVSSWK